MKQLEVELQEEMKKILQEAALMVKLKHIYLFTRNQQLLETQQRRSGLQRFTKPPCFL